MFFRWEPLKRTFIERVCLDEADQCAKQNRHREMCVKTDLYLNKMNGFEADLYRSSQWYTH